MEISENARDFGFIFNTDIIGEDFFNNITKDFDSYEKSVDTSKSGTVSNDIIYIIQCASESLKAASSNKRFPNRVDAYFYICNKIDNIYSGKNNPLRKFTHRDEDDLTKLIMQFLRKLGEIFRFTKGVEPVLLTKSATILKLFDIPKYMSFITTINNQTKDQFFAVYRLLLQWSSAGYEERLQWKNILSQKRFEISLSDFVNCYNSYKEVFQDCQLDIDAFISLIYKIHPHKTGEKSSLLVHHISANDLNLNQTDFLKSFQNIFISGVSQNCYDCDEVARFLWILRGSGRLFKSYLTFYYSYLPVSKNIWKVLYHMSEKWEMNDIIEKYLSDQILMHVNTTHIGEFLSSIDECMKHLQKIKPENCAYYKTIIETIFEAHIKNLLTNEKSPDRLSHIELKTLLKISLELSKTREISQSSTLLIVERLLFPLKKSTDKVIDRIQTLFQNLRGFDQDPYQAVALTDMIEDRMFRDVLIGIPGDFCTWLTHNVYRDLCENYKNNKWAHFIWSRIINLSISKSKSGNPNNMLARINEWMFVVGHHFFHEYDTLTITLVTHLFEIILKDVESVLTLLDIPYIIEFLLNIKEKQVTGINMQDLNAFVDNEQRRIEDILLLKGKLNLDRAKSQ